MQGLLVLLALLGAYSLITGCWAAIALTRAALWPTVPAVVVASDMVSSPGLFGFGSHWRFTIQYSYDVNGRTYTSSTYSLIRGNSIGRGNTRASAEDFVHSHPPGTPLTVRYNPSNPAMATLLSGADWYGLAIGLIGGAVFIVIGVRQLRAVRDELRERAASP